MMNRFSSVLGVSFVCFALGPGAASAQGLADVAKKEAERRETVKAPAKVYTNTSLVPDFTSPPPPPAPAPAPAVQETKPAPVSASPDEEPLQVPVAAKGTEVERQAPSDKGEDYWRGKAAAIRTAIAGQKAQIAALESRIADLSQGKTGTDQRESELSSGVLDRARADLVSLQEEQARFENLAKLKKVPASWLR